MARSASLDTAAGAPALAPRIDAAIRATATVVAIAAAIYLGAALWIGWQDIARSIAALGVLALLGGIGMASLNYLLRFARWRMLLARMGQHVPWLDNLRVYVGGLALTATPGKVGETLRSALLLHWNVPVGASLAAFFIDRLTDLVGVLVLAAVTGDAWFWWLLAAITVSAGGGLRWVFATGHAELLAAWLERRPHAAGAAAFVRSGMRHYIAGWSLPTVGGYVLIAFVAYGLQGLVFAHYVGALGGGIGQVHALHIFAASTLAGAASFLPGGLGAMEIALVAQLHAAGMPLVEATAAAVAVRAVTLWFGIIAGLVCLLWYRRAARSPVVS